jgi:hypothetical protein
MEDALVERDPSLEDQHLPTSTEAEFDMYAWPLGVDGKPRKEVPIDLYNHGMDAMRYLVCYLDGVGRTFSGVRLL